MVSEDSDELREDVKGMDKDIPDRLPRMACALGEGKGERKASLNCNLFH